MNEPAPTDPVDHGGVIDLGRLGRPERDGGERGDLVRRLRAWWRRRRPAVLATMPLLLVLGLVGGAVPWQSTGPVTIGSAGRFEVVGDLLLVAESGTRWAAYDPSTGVRRWSLVRPDGAPLGLVARDGILFDTLLGGSAMVLDPATGGPLWSPERIQGQGLGLGRFDAVPGTPTGVAVGDYRRYSGEPFAPEYAHQIKGIDLATGRVRWQERPPTGVWVALLGDPPVVVTSSAAGVVELRDLATGRVQGRRQVAAAPGATGPAAARPTMLTGDRLVLETWSSGELVLRGYTVGTLARRWEREVTLVGETWVNRCGPMLCVHHTEQSYRDGTVVDPLTGHAWRTSDTEVVDPATGRVAWVARAGRTLLHPVGDRFLAYDGRGALQGVVDARTGRTLRPLDGWQAVTPVTGDGRVTLLRPDREGSTRMARLDLATLELSGGGRLPGQPDRCQPLPEGLVCRYGSDIWVWAR